MRDLHPWMRWLHWLAVGAIASQWRSTSWSQVLPPVLARRVGGPTIWISRQRDSCGHQRPSFRVLWVKPCPENRVGGADDSALAEENGWGTHHRRHVSLSTSLALGSSLSAACDRKCSWWHPFARSRGGGGFAAWPTSVGVCSLRSALTEVVEAVDSGSCERRKLVRGL